MGDEAVTREFAELIGQVVTIMDVSTQDLYVWWDFLDWLASLLRIHTIETRYEVDLSEDL